MKNKNDVVVLHQTYCCGIINGFNCFRSSLSISSEVENVHTLGLSNSSHSICLEEWSSNWGVHILVVI